MATYTKQITHEATLTADEVDTITITGRTVTSVDAGPAEPPYVAAGGAQTEPVLGFIYRNRSGVDQAITWGTTTPPDPDTGTPVDGQLTLGPNDVWDCDLVASDIVIKALSASTGAYQIVVKTR